MAERRQDHVRLECQSRDTGTAASKRLRRLGLVPAVVYGGKGEPMAISVEAATLNKVLSAHTGPVLDANLPGGVKARLLVRDLYRYPLDGKIWHVDFQRVTAGQTIRSDVPVTLDDESLIIRQGLIPSWSTTHLHIEAAPDALPEALHISAVGLEFGRHVTAAEIDLPAGVKMLTAPETLVLSVVAPRVEVVAEAAPAVAEVGEAAAETPDEAD